MIIIVFRMWESQLQVKYLADNCRVRLDVIITLLIITKP